jgi:hypothetical protein
MNIRILARTPLLSLALFFGLLPLSGCGTGGKTGEDPKVTTLGQVEVTAKLVEIPGDFPPNDLYDYAFVLKYEVLKVHRGNVEGKTIYVGHYNPLKTRLNAADARSGEIGGSLSVFRAGDVHRMALAQPIDEHFMGGIVNQYEGKSQGPIYWAIWTNRAYE